MDRLSLEASTTLEKIEEMIIGVVGELQDMPTDRIESINWVISYEACYTNESTKEFGTINGVLTSSKRSWAVVAGLLYVLKMHIISQFNNTALASTIEYKK
jgi:hypothetical protein